MAAGFEIPLSGEQQDLVDAVGRFCERECSIERRRARAGAGESPGHSPEIYAEMAALGWMGLALDPADGGAGRTLADACLFVEAAWRGLAPISGYGTSLVVARTIARFGSDSQRELVAAIATGAIAAIAITEPGAGSDIAAIATRARADRDGFVLDGQKVFCSNAAVADRILVACRTGPADRGHDGLALVLVEPGNPGLRIEPIATMGGSDACRLELSGCHVSEDAIVGKAGDGWPQLMALLDLERLVIAAVQLGVARRAFDEALAYVKRRHQFGRAIGSFQAVGHRLADLATELQAARLMVGWAAEAADRGPGRAAAAASAMAKLQVTEAAKRTTLDCMQMMGAHGYASEHELERLVRESLAGTIYGGTSEIQRGIVARNLGL